ncbi:MAG: chemotaxis protein CheB [Deltaproteobacteria bacterium]|nr:chemotaxis protein CheB [Deltaproteobacteria bacterium]
MTRVLVYAADVSSRRQLLETLSSEARVTVAGTSFSLTSLASKVHRYDVDVVCMRLGELDAAMRELHRNLDARGIGVVVVSDREWRQLDGKAIVERILLATKKTRSTRQQSGEEWGARVAAIGVGASTGGPKALSVLLRALPPNGPPIVIVQHLPADKTARFAASLSQIANSPVQEIVNDEPLCKGRIYLAPGGSHTVLVPEASVMRGRLIHTAPVNEIRPAVDVMFQSLANKFGRQAIGVLLTGMGKDGAMGLLEMMSAGAYTMVQDQSTSVVWGMPGAAVSLNAAAEVVALPDLAERLVLAANAV